MALKILLQEAGVHLEAFLKGRGYILESKDLKDISESDNFFFPGNLMRITSIIYFIRIFI